MPTFSILTVTLNNLGGLQRTSASIMQQSCKDFEWLVQDGGSTDGSLEYLRATTDAQTESGNDSGIYNAMNRLIARCKGNYLLFLNAGDELAAPETLKLLQQFITHRAPDFLYGDATEEDKIKKSRSHIAAKYGMFTHHQSMLYKREKIEELRYNETYKIAADYDFTCRFLQKNSNAFYTETPICIFESGGISQQKSSLGRHEQFQIRQDLNLCPPLENQLITAAQFLNWQLRRFAPLLYWLSKSFRNTAPAMLQNQTPPRRPKTRA